MNNLVSIVIPSYNCAHFLSRAIQSVLDQTYSNWELFVIDNYSTDNTIEVVSCFQDVRIKVLQIHNDGVIAKSRNLGIKSATGRWVAFLDADDWWTPEKLERSVNALLAGNDFVYHDLVRKGPGKRLINGRFVRTRQVISPCFYDLLANGNGIVNSSVVVCRKLLLEIGGLSENPLLVAAEDYDCWLRISQKTEKFFRLSQAYGFYWIGYNNVHTHIDSLQYLSVIYTLYINKEMSKLVKMPLWLLFSLSKYYFKKGDYEQSLHELSKVDFRNMSCRCAVMVLILKLSILFYSSFLPKMKLK